jgi:ATP-binding cassette, subfamily B, bacterial PglK
MTQIASAMRYGHVFLAILSRRQKAWLGLLMGLSVAEALFELVAVVTLAPIFSLILNPDGFDKLATRFEILGYLLSWSYAEKMALLSGVFTATYALRMCIRMANLSLSSRYLENLRHEVAISVLERTLDKNFLDVLLAPPATTAAKVTHDAIGVSAIARDALGLASAAVSVSALAGAIVLTTGSMGAAALFGALLIGASILRLNLFRGRHIGTANRKSQEQLPHILVQLIGAFREMTVFSVRKNLVKRFDSESERFRDSSRAAKIIQKMPSIVVEGVLFVGLGVTLFVASSAQIDLVSNAPLIGTFVFAVARLLPQILQIVSFASSIQFSLVALRSISAMPARAAAQTSVRAAPQPAAEIVFDDLTFAFPNAAAPTLSGLTCRIPAGSFVAIVGSSGTGKSTLTNILLGFLAPTSGQILLNGVPLAERIASWHASVAFVPQDPFFLATTIRDNIEFSRPSLGDAHLWKMLAAANFADAVAALPGGLDHPCGADARNLSGGQRQRLAIARALYADPAVLVFDEPTSALDHENARAIEQTLLSFKGKKTIFLSTHMLEFVRHCDRLVFLQKSLPAIAGDAAELLETCEPVQRYFAQEPLSARA